MRKSDWIRTLRDGMGSLRNGVFYCKWKFPTARPFFNPTYAEKVNKKILEEIVSTIKNYKSILWSPIKNLEQKYPDVCFSCKEMAVYSLEQRSVFKTMGALSIKTVNSLKSLSVWGQIVSKIYPRYDVDFILHSFKDNIHNKNISYYIFYKDDVPVGCAEIFRGKEYSIMYKLGVLPDYRRQGLGTEAIKQVLNKDIKNKRCKFLLIPSEDGINIYKRLGFKLHENLYIYKLKHSDWLNANF